MSDTTTDVFTRPAADEGAPSNAPASSAPTEVDSPAVEPTAASGNGQPTAATRRRAGGLNGMVLPELQQLASTLGVKGTARMRKSQLVEAIQAAQSATAVPAGSNGSAGAAPVASAQPTSGQSAPAELAPAEPAPAESPERSAAEQLSSQQPASSPSQHDRSAPRQRSPQGHQDRQPAQERAPQQTHSDRSAEAGDRRDEDDEGSSRSRRRRRARDRYRDRDRDRDRRSSAGRPGERYDEPAVNEEDVLIPVAGIVDILDSYAFVRTSGYLPGPDDVYVSLSMVKRYGLRKGDAVTGAVRQPREGDKQQKFNALARIDTLNGSDAESGRQRAEFSRLTPLYPQDRLRLETEPGVITTRIIDLFAPIGKGQRGLIVSPSKAGKTMVLQAIANAITTNNPECHLMVVLVDERPEEVTDMQRAVKGEVISSTFDRPAADHTTAAELAIERAKRLVELGHDVVVLLDSITRLGRAYNLAAPASGRILSGGVDSSALYPPKRFFGAARNIEHGGSLTILATALVETGSKMDEVIFEEFKGTGNMELRLSRGLADKRIFPAMDVDASGTRKEELLMGKEELAIAWKLRRVLSGLESQQAIELLLDKLKSTRSNIEFLMQVQKTMPLPAGSGGED